MVSAFKLVYGFPHLQNVLTHVPPSRSAAIFNSCHAASNRHFRTGLKRNSGSCCPNPINLVKLSNAAKSRDTAEVSPPVCLIIFAAIFFGTLIRPTRFRSCCRGIERFFVRRSRFPKADPVRFQCSSTPFRSRRDTGRRQTFDPSNRKRRSK